jgi:hypothetical protein
MKIYSYVLRFDDGAAPNPFWKTCTLTICKPVIRRNAEIGDWVIGTGSKNSRCNDGKIYDLSQKLVYAMKIDSIKTLEDYDSFCARDLPNKIPDWNSDDWRRLVGDCIYDYSQSSRPKIRGKVHDEGNRATDIRGINALLSKHFYYFGEAAVDLPDELKPLIKTNRGHKKIVNEELVAIFEKWIVQFKLNTLYGEPQLMSHFKGKLRHEACGVCSSHHQEETEDEVEETLC